MKLTEKCAHPRGALAALAPAIAAVLLSGCGGASSSAGVAHLRSSTASSAATGARASPGSRSPEAEALAFARCMRSHGLPDFPDPSAGGGFRFHTGAGVNPSSPAFKAAQANCKSLLPAGGPPSTTHPSSQVLARMLAVSQCMRRHGVEDFPDPRTSVPANPFGSGRGGVISDIEEVIFIFPQAIDMHSPQFTRAAAACAFPLHNH